MSNYPSPRRRPTLFAACALAVAGVSVLAAMPGAAIGQSPSQFQRPEADVAQDAARKPAMMVRFAKIKSGSTVVDILPGSGYFTRIFSNAVGAGGKVYAAAPQQSAELAALSREPGRRNVRLHIGSLTEVAPAGSAHVVWTSRNYHDLKGAKAPADAAAAVNKAAFAALRPGGYYVVLDHSAAPGSGFRDVDSLHRVDAEAVKAEVVAAGFVFEEESKMLANPEDDRTKAVFDPSVQGRTDQFILRFRKPG